MELAPWTAPSGHTADPRRLSLERPRPLPSAAPRSRDARDLPFYDSWVPHPATGLTPAALMSAFRLAEQGYPQIQVDMIDDLIEGDGHARNLFEHRERVVAKAPPVVNGDASAEGQAAASALQFAMNQLALRVNFEHLLRVNRHGYAAVEVDWDIVELAGRRWVLPVWLTPVPARRFRIGVQGMAAVPRYPDGTPTGETEVRFDDLRLYQKLETPQGHPLRAGKWITLKRQPSQVSRSGLGRTAAVYIMAKRFSFRDWIILSERYGIPWPIVKVDQFEDQATKDAARQIITSLGSDGGAVVGRDGFELEIKEGVKADKPMQAALIAFCNSEISKLINGSTLRNDNASGAGSYGLGSVHDAVAWDELRADGELLSEAMTLQLGAAFHRFNQLTSAPPTITMMVEPDLGPEEFASLAVKATNELGIKVSQKQFRERTGMRVPLNAEDEAPGMQVEKFPTAAGGPP